MTLEVDRRLYTESERKVVRGLLALFGFLLVVAFLYAHSHKSVEPVNSDHASSVLAAQDMASGNVFLDGWLLPPNTYWSTDLPILSVLTGPLGADPVLLHLGPAVIAAGVVLVAARLAWLEHKRLAWLGAGVVVVLLALPHPVLSYSFLLGPQHVGTALACLIAFMLLASDDWRRRRWWLGVVLMALAYLADPFAVAIGVAPVAVAGLTRALRQRRAGAALPSLVAAGGSVAIGFVLGRVIRGIGGYELARALPLTSPERRFENVEVLPQQFLSLLGFGSRSELDTLDRLLHGLGAVLVVGALVLSLAMVLGAIVRSVLLRRPVSNTSSGGIGDPWLDDALLAGALGGAVVFVLLARPPADITSTRYLSASLIFGVVLAGRRVAGLKLDRPTATSAVRVGFAVVAGAYLVSSLLVLRVPEPPTHGQELAPWLASLGLRDGFGTYWLASISTVESRGDVRVRSVIRGGDNLLHVHRFNSSSRWYERAGRPHNFFVFMPGRGTSGIERSATATFGPPSDKHDFRRYRVLVWDKDLLEELAAPIPRPS